MLMTGVGALQNIGVINNTMNAPAVNQITPPRMEAPYLSGIGSDIANIPQGKSIARSGNATRRLLVEMGKPELALGVNDQELRASEEMAIQGLAADHEIMAKNDQAYTEIENLNKENQYKSRVMNQEMQAKQNEIDSQTISNALNQLYAMGNNLSNLLGQSDYYGMIAGNMSRDQTRAKAENLASPLAREQ